MQGRTRRLLTIVLAGLIAAATVLIGTPAFAQTRTPVVFVHGYGGSASNWNTAQTVFRADGYSSSLLFTYDYNSNTDLTRSAAGLSTFVEQVKARTGSATVDVVNHSMGGLVTQWYVHELGGASSVEHVASIAGANHGTTYASGCISFPSCRQMYPGSSFIQRVTSGDETPAPTQYATWYSACDGIIIPYTSTRLSGATNNSVLCETHLGFLTNSGVFRDVADWLN